jgi:hypothetical protein
MIDIEKMRSDMAAAYPGGGCVGVKLAFGRRRSAGSLTLG